MAVVVNVKTTQVLPKITSWRSQEGFFVDDSYTKGLKKATFGTIITGKSGGRVAPVISYAGAVGATYTDISEDPAVLGPAKAIGVIYETSPIDQYRRVDDLSDETRLFPLGARTDKKYALMPSCVLEVTDTDEVNGTVGYFRLVDKELPTATSFDDATATIVFSGNIDDVRKEEKLEIDGAFYWIVDIEYDSGADETTITLNEGAGDTVEDIIVKSQLFETAYLADDMDGDVPFTMIPEVGRQEVGFVESMFALRVSTLNII